MKRFLSFIVCALLFSSCAPGDPFVGKWRGIGPNSDQNDLEIERSAGEYIWRDAQGTFKGVLKDKSLLISRSLNVADVKLASVEMLCTVTDNRKHMDCSSKASASVLSIEAGTLSYERQ